MRIKLLSIFVFLVLTGQVYAATVIPFSSPENSYGVLADYLGDLNHSVYLSGYTFTSLDIANKLIDAKMRGLDVKVLLDASPVSGVSNLSIEIFCRLYSNNISVHLYTGDLRFLHGKYIIGDNKSILVSSENFGEGGYSKKAFANRGWGSLIFDMNSANKLLDIFFSDLKTSQEFTCEKKKNWIKQTATEKNKYKLYSNQEVDIISAPENAVDGILNLLNSAKTSIYVQQFYIRKGWGDKENPFLDTLINKARQGIEVKILVDSSDYNLEGKDNNLKTINYINKIAEDEKLNLQAKLIDLDFFVFREAHNKGVLVDNNTALVSSINWNENSPKYNREIGVIIKGDSAEYFLDLFLKDWNVGSIATGKIVEESKNQIIYIIIFVFGLCGIYYLVKHFPRKSKTFLS